MNKNRAVYKPMESLYNSYFVGFDEMLLPTDTQRGYPPYNIQKLEDGTYNIQLAIAGFSRDDLSVELYNNTLIISGKSKEDTNSYLYKGISNRSFYRKFKLAESVKVNEVVLKDGMLRIVFEVHTPEKKPTSIEIKNA